MAPNINTPPLRVSFITHPPPLPVSSSSPPCRDRGGRPKRGAARPRSSDGGPERGASASLPCEVAAPSGDAVWPERPWTQTAAAERREQPDPWWRREPADPVVARREAAARAFGRRAWLGGGGGSCARGQAGGRAATASGGGGDSKQRWRPMGSAGPMGFFVFFLFH